MKNKDNTEKTCKENCKKIASKNKFVIYEEGDSIYKDSEVISFGVHRWYDAWLILKESN